MSENKYEVVAPDGKRYRVDYGKVQRLQGVDLAVLQFQSNESYRVATLANYNWRFEERRWVFLSGWPGLKPGEVRSSDPEFTAGLVFSKEAGSLSVKDSYSLTEASGYELVYTNPAQAGMSGGPVLDVDGRVIGIHAAAEGEQLLEEGVLDQIQLGYSLGVPVRTFLSLASRADVKAKWLQVEKSPSQRLTEQEGTAIREALFTVEKPSKNAKATDWVNYGNNLWRLEKYEEAVAAFDEAIKLKPSFEQAWYARGLALKSQQSKLKFQETFASFDKATEINPSFYQAWRERGSALLMLQRYPEGLASVDKAISLNSEDSSLYYLRGMGLVLLEKYTEAVEAYSQAIELNHNSFLYSAGGGAYLGLKDYQKALADYNKAIDINPYSFLAYGGRSAIYIELGDEQAADADSRKYAQLLCDSGYYSRDVCEKIRQEFRRHLQQ